jgi:hypothetical protein
MNLEFLLCTVQFLMACISSLRFAWNELIYGVCMYHTFRTFVTPRSTYGYVPIISTNSLCLILHILVTFNLLATLMDVHTSTSCTYVG